MGIPSRPAFNKITQLALALAIGLTFAAACAPIAKGRGGAQDGGGGAVPKSTPAQVEGALRKAFQMGGESNPRRNIFVKFMLDFLNHRKLGKGLYPSRFFPNFTKGNVSPEEYEAEFNKAMRGFDAFGETQRPSKLTFDLSEAGLHSPALQRLKFENLELRKRGDCPSKDSKHADASVSSKTLSGSICFSIGNLERLTSDVLFKHVLALAIHEAAHLAGAEESEAERWQKAFTNYFEVTFEKVDRSETALLEAVSTSHLSVMVMIQDLVDNPDVSKSDWSTRISIHLSALFTMTQESEFGFKAFKDRLRSNLTFNPKRPELFNVYSNSVAAVLEKSEGIWDKYGDSSAAVNKVETHQHLTADLRALLDLIKKAETNLQAYLSGAGSPACLLPSKPAPNVWWNRVPLTCEP